MQTAPAVIESPAPARTMPGVAMIDLKWFVDP
jgi:hypothetical protein